MLRAGPAGAAERAGLARARLPNADHAASPPRGLDGPLPRRGPGRSPERGCDVRGTDRPRTRPRR
eukprot:6951353-Lingulodinium_polyedra.AAC.1